MELVSNFRLLGHLFPREFNGTHPWNFDSEFAAKLADLPGGSPEKKIEGENANEIEEFD